MIKSFLKKCSGFAAQDALIAILIIALFSGLVATISYNIYLSNTSIKRMSKANGYITEIFEYTDKMYYDDITKENLTSYFNKKYYYEENSNTPKKNAEVKMQEQVEGLTTPFKIYLQVTKYNETQGNQDKLDLVKQIKIIVKYNLGGKEQTIEMKRIKSRENIKIPNIPDLSLLSLTTGKKAYPIKRINNTWKVCDTKDETWYNYDNGNWAMVFTTTKDLNINDEVDVNILETGEQIYAWIPRYAYNNNELVFLYSNGNKYVEKINEYDKLTTIDEKTYKVPTDFVKGDEQLTGVWSSDSTTTVFQTLNTFYNLKV